MLFKITLKIETFTMLLILCVEQENSIQEGRKKQNHIFGAPDKILSFKSDVNHI
jgi:hypothetical protein